MLAKKSAGADIHFGLGRENGLESINEYTEVESVWVKLSGRPATRSLSAKRRSIQ